MALKDWRKDGLNDWFHKKENKHISIIMIRGTKWGVIDNDGIWKNLLFSSGNKLQALKFAKSYMRTH